MLIPYVVFGVIHDIIYVFVKGRDAALTALGHLFWENTSGLPIAGALWFLTALFFVTVGYFIIDRYISSVWGKSILIFAIAVFGCCAKLILPFRLPWALDAAFVGLGLYHIAYLMNSRKGFAKKIFNIKLLPTILLGAVATILIFINGYINMREGTYAIIPLFWLNAILAIFYVKKVIGRLVSVRYENVIILVVTLVLLFLADKVIRKTKLKVIIGK